MSKPFNIFIESNNAALKKKYVDNQSTEFTIYQPERVKLDEWQVSLKSLITPSRIWNIYDEMMPHWSLKSTKFSFKFSEF